MTILNKTLVALSVPLFAMSAHSAVSYGSSSAGQVYVGAKLGLLDVDVADKKTPLMAFMAVTTLTKLLV